MVALITFVIIVVVVALLCVTGSRYKYEKRNSVDSLQLDDGGIVSYELRASKRRNVQHLRCRFCGTFSDSLLYFCFIFRDLVLFVCFLLSLLKQPLAFDWMLS